jgi:glycosyltransferase involved in cell wall biosynthesis
MKVTRVLHVLGNLDSGGLENRLMDIYRHIDKTKIQFDFLIHTTKPTYFEEEIHRLGGKIYRIRKLRFLNIWLYIHDLKKFFKRNNTYSIIHGHILGPALFYHYIAKKAGVACRIVHSRNGRRTEKDFISIIKSLVERYAWIFSTHRFAVSETAAISAFGKNALLKGKVQILPNAIDIRKYLFNQVAREKVRKDLDLSNKLVVGHIGRFSVQKNHEFLLKVFSEIVLLEPNSVLILVGKGDLEESIKNQCSGLGIEDKVRFLGVRSDVPDLLQAMDVIVFPSFYEGLPGVILEAQAAGLPCIISDKITKEARITDLVEYLPLTISAKEWAEVVLEKEKSTERRVTLDEFIEAGFDIESVARWYQEFYLAQV